MVTGQVPDRETVRMMLAVERLREARRVRNRRVWGWIAAFVVVFGTVGGAAAYQQHQADRQHDRETALFNGMIGR